MMESKTIKIAGAGPSGLTAAINLSMAGYQVDVFEKRADACRCFHGELQGLKNWSEPTNMLEELRSMNIKINFDADPFLHQVITNGSKSRTSHYPADKCAA